jgi:hypothetical protein
VGVGAVVVLVFTDGGVDNMTGDGLGCTFIYHLSPYLSVVIINILYSKINNTG